jgi:putative membrane protein
MRKLTVPFAAATIAAGIFPVVAFSAPNQHPAAPAAPAEVTSRLALDDPTIVAIFDAANTADIETGDLAAKQGNSKEVRQLGAMFARDHRMVRQQGRDLAKKLGVTPTPPKDDQSAKQLAETMATLRSKHGADFDKAYLEHEVAFHKAVIDAIDQQLLPAIQNEELKALVQKVAPAFKAHMMAAQSLDTKLFGGETSSK